MILRRSAAGGHSVVREVGGPRFRAQAFKARSGQYSLRSV
jgi:hypothetical protein